MADEKDVGLSSSAAAITAVVASRISWKLNEEYTEYTTVH